ncbi:MAG TPA: hypothetical protein VMZ92_22165 [Planctomycetota bacterium]|nr:hypothetical protein [Planctomycetota bacterium]
MLTDSVGGKWDFRPTIGALRRFERRTDIRLFSRIGKALPEDLASVGKVVDGTLRVNVRAIAELFSSILDGFDAAAALLFECRVWAGDGNAPKPMSFDDFCERFALEQVGEALVKAMMIIVSCVTGAKIGSELLTAGGVDPASPLVASDGPASTPSRE